jgi:hypothetical protein
LAVAKARSFTGFYGKSCNNSFILNGYGVVRSFAGEEAKKQQVSEPANLQRGLACTMEVRSI